MILGILRTAITKTNYFLTIPHLLIASGPWISETSSMGPSATNTRAISKDPVDFTQTKIYYPGKEKAPRSNPFDGENRYGLYI